MLFDHFTWVLFLAPFAGFLLACFAKRTNPEIRGNKILRHDLPARISHWSHALGCVCLLISGVILGTRFTNAIFGPEAPTFTWFNVHFIFAIFFLFGTFFWLGNTIVSPYRFKEHLPSKGALKSILNHYGSVLKIKGCTYPKEEKYFESERTAFLMAVCCSALVIISGAIKALAHIFDFPAEMMGVVFWAHDIGAVLMLLFLLAHVFFGVLIPIAWKAAPSMIHGYISLEDAEEEYPAWVEQLKKEAAEKGSEDTVEKGSDQDDQKQ